MMVELLRKLDVWWERVGVDLTLQYKGFRFLFWFDFIVATICVLIGEFNAGGLFALLGITFGGIANQKLVIINQNTFLRNQETFLSSLLRVEDKLDVLLEDE